MSVDYVVRPFFAPPEVLCQPLGMLGKQLACDYSMNQQQKLPGSCSDLWAVPPVGVRARNIDDAK